VVSQKYGGGAQWPKTAARSGQNEKFSEPVSIVGLDGKSRCELTFENY